MRFEPTALAWINPETEKVLSIAETMANDLISPIAAGRLRHRLDVANAYTQLQQYGEATRVIQEVRATAPSGSLSSATPVTSSAQW